MSNGGGIIGFKRTAAVVSSVIFACAYLVLAMSGCSSRQPQKYTRDFFAMDTFMSLTAYSDNGDDPQNVKDLLESVECRISGLEQSLSVTIPESDISRLNSLSGQPVSVGADALEIIQKSLEISGKTGGALDITIYPVLKAWGFTTGEYRVPESGELERLLAFTDHTKVRISGDQVTLPEEFSVDTGALAKGYASDCACEIIRNGGVSSAIINLGGNVCAIGSKPDGTPWKVAVASPFEDEEYAGIIDVQDKFVITSGKYERYFTAEDGRKYHHIIDPQTGYPSENGLAAVTVIGDSGIECDALSTALMVLGEEKAAEYWRENGGFDMILITDDKRIIVTAGIAEQFTNSTEHSLEVLN